MLKKEYAENLKNITDSSSFKNEVSHLRSFIEKSIEPFFRFAIGINQKMKEVEKSDLLKGVDYFTNKQKDRLMFKLHEFLIKKTRMQKSAHQINPFFKSIYIYYQKFP